MRLMHRPAGKNSALAFTLVAVVAHALGCPGSATAEEIALFIGHKDQPIIDVCFSEDGSQLASIGHDCAVKVWNVKDQKCLRTFTYTFRTPPHYAQFLPSGEHLLVVTRRIRRGVGWEVRLCNVKTGEQTVQLSSAANEIPLALWLDMNLLVVTSEDDTNRQTPYALKFLDLGGKKHSFLRSGSPMRLLTATHDKARVVVEEGKGLVRVINRASGKAVAAFATHAGGCAAAALTPDGKTLVTLPKDPFAEGISFWDVAKGKEKYRRPASLHKSAKGSLPSLLALSPDGRILAAPRGTVFFFDFKTERFEKAQAVGGARDSPTFASRRTARPTRRASVTARCGSSARPS